MRLYIKYLALHLRSAMQYKTSFFLTVFGQFLLSFSMFLEITFLFARFHSVEGFTYSEVLLCFGVVLLAFSLAECFARGFDAFPSLLANGGFDRILVRPRSAVFQVLATKMELTRVGRLLQAVLIFAYAIPTCGAVWTWDRILALILMIAGGVTVFSGLFMMYAALCFFTTEGLEFMNVLTDGGREFGKYPFGIYGKKLLLFFTFLVPLALFQYYPLLYLLGRTDNPLYMLAPLGEGVFLLPCLLLWKIGVRRYTSTGS